MSGPFSSVLPSGYVTIPPRTGLGADEVFPWLIDVDVFEQAVSHVNWDGVSSSLGVILGGYKFSSGAQNDEISFDVVLAAGTWTVELLHFKVPSGGIFSLYLGATSLGTIDNYAAVNTPSTLNSISGVIIPLAALYRLTLRMETKNVSSTNYGGLLQHIQFRRTA